MPITVACIVVAFGASPPFGRLLEARPKMSMPIGAGTAIYGTSAIIATAPVIHVNDEDLAIPVNLLGLTVMFCFPLLGGLLKMPQETFVDSRDSASVDRGLCVWRGSRFPDHPGEAGAGDTIGAVSHCAGVDLLPEQGLRRSFLQNDPLVSMGFSAAGGVDDDATDSGATVRLS